MCYCLFCSSVAPVKKPPLLQSNIFPSSNTEDWRYGSFGWNSLDCKLWSLLKHMVYKKVAVAWTICSICCLHYKRNGRNCYEKVRTATADWLPSNAICRCYRWPFRINTWIKKILSFNTPIISIFNVRCDVEKHICKRT